MELSLKKSSISMYENFSSKAEQSIETEISLPEYCPDIQRIMKCTCNINLLSYNIQGDRATAEGNAIIRLIYLSEENKLISYEHNYPFSKQINVGGANYDTSLCVKAKTEYINCRAISQRRISVTGNIHLLFTAIKQNNFEFIDGCEEIETKCTSIDVSLLSGNYSKMFDMSETAETQSEKDEVLSVLQSYSWAMIDNVKIIKNKILAKGEMITEITYISSDNNTIKKLRHSMPISQIAEVTGVEEGDTVLTNIIVKSSVCNIKTNSDGVNNLIDITIKAELNVRDYKKTQISIVTDSYSTCCDVINDYKEEVFSSLLFLYDETKQFRYRLDDTSLSIKEIVEVFPVSVQGTASFSEGKIIVNTQSTIGILFSDSDNAFGYLEKTVDNSFDVPCPKNNGDIVAEPLFTLRDILWSGLDIQINLNTYMPVFENFSQKVCMNISINNEAETTQNPFPLIVYFPDENEELWNIAKKYRTTEKKIKEENNISDEIVSGGMLMIPI